MSTVKEPLHPLRTARYLWLGILLCALVGGACFLGGRWSAGRSETAKIDTVVLQNQLSEIRELATVTYAYTNMAQFESSNDFYGVKIPFTTKSFILTYDGTVKAGVDLDGAEVSVSGTTVTITLPEAEILSHEIDPSSIPSQWRISPPSSRIRRQPWRKRPCPAGFWRRLAPKPSPA